MSVTNLTGTVWQLNEYLTPYEGSKTNFVLNAEIVSGEYTISLPYTVGQYEYYNLTLTDDSNKQTPVFYFGTYGGSTATGYFISYWTENGWFGALKNAGWRYHTYNYSPSVPLDANTPIISPPVLRINGGEDVYDTELISWLELNAVQVHTSFIITTSLINCTSNIDNPSSINRGGTANLIYIPNKGYKLSNISVNGATIDSWNKYTGSLVISNPTKDVSITVTAIEKTLEENRVDGVGYETQIPIYSSTVFNSHIKLTASGVSSLASVIINPPVLPSIFTKPNDWISNLTFYPFDVYAIESADLKLRIGGIDTDVPCRNVNNAFCFFNMGEYLYKPLFNNFADYNGYTKIKIQLPYYGEVEIMPNDVINKYIQFRLKVDYNSGQAVWIIGVSDETIPLIIDNVIANDNGYNIRVLSQHTFQIGIHIPLGSTNTAEVYRNIIMGAVKATGTAIGAYVLSASGSTGGTSTTKVVTTARNPHSGRQIKTGTETRTSTYDGSNYQRGRAISACFDVATDSLNSMQLSASSDKPNMSILLNNLSKNIIITRFTPKILPVDADYGKLYGYPVGDTYKLSQLSGYTEVTNIHFEGTEFNSATSKEFALIEQAFTDGVILP